MAHDSGKDHTGGIRRSYTGTHPRNPPFHKPGGTYPRDDISRSRASMPYPHGSMPYSRAPRSQSSVPRGQNSTQNDPSRYGAQSDPSRSSGVSRNGGGAMSVRNGGNATTVHNSGNTTSVPQSLNNGNVTSVPRSFREALFPFDENRTALNRRAFLLGLLFTGIYVLTFAACNMPLNVFTARFPPFAAEFIRTVIPAATGTGFCTLSWLMFPRERRMMPFAFRSLTRLSVIAFVILQLLLWGESDAQWTIADFFARFVIAPLFMGQIVSLWLFYRHWKRLA